MIRTQIQITEKQSEALRKLAAAERKPLADLIRRGVDLYLHAGGTARRKQLVQRALRAAGRFSSGTPDGSAEHDRHLAEAFRR
jgi:hypothetical protein